MADKPWFSSVETIRPHVVRIVTPEGRGTGFLLHCDSETGLSVIATAAHVVSHAHDWEQPIRIEHDGSEGPLVLRHGDRAVFLDQERDTAGLLISDDTLKLPPVALPRVEQSRHLRVGVEIGWLGYPANAKGALCFFGGKVSAWLKDQDAYLVDGVAINGVSGGPAFYVVDDRTIIMGVVAAYVPNRATGEALPGLAIVRGVAHLNEMVDDFSSVDEAKTEETPAGTDDDIPF